MSKFKTIVTAVFLISILIYKPVYAQEIILKVKKGIVTKNNMTITQQNPVFRINAEDSIFVSRLSLVLANFGNQFVELPNNRSFKYNEILKLIRSKKIVKKDASLIRTIFINNMQNIDNNAGISTRSVGKPANFYEPADSLGFLTDSIVLKFGNKETKVSSNFQVKNLTNGKVYYDGIPTNNKIILTHLPLGTYLWTGKLETSFTIIEHNNYFIIRDKPSKDIFLKKLAVFNKHLEKEGFSDEMKELLVKEFYMSEKFYFNRH
tara:strand:- start:206 stop:994 length:789 start_codon:yes stop_codon:yes gene_type:complete